MGVEPPFLYDHPTKYSFTSPSEKGFNPKAASQASWSPSRPRARIEGPLIQSKEFNRHPDTYFVVPYGNLDSKPMSPRTKTNIKWTRLLQLVLRILALVGAAGMLVCVICIKGTDAATGWIIRVPPGVAILHTIYAIYHLARSSRGRTPASTASYMLFAAIIDAGLIPFFVFTALVCRAEYTEPADTTGRWKTLFNDDATDYKILHSTFLISVVNGGIHLVSLLTSIYLGVVFRKISRLPPDMNPLEDSLTSRHKRNKSSLLDDCVIQDMTGTSSTNHDSRAKDPLISPARTVPFMHTRNDSHTNISNLPYPDFSPRGSHNDISTPLYKQSSSSRSSRTNIQDCSSSQARSNSKSHTYFPNLIRAQQPTIQPTVPDLTRSPTKSSSIYSSSTAIATARPPSTVSSLPDSNWITHPSPSPSPTPPRELNHVRKQFSYQPLLQTASFEYAPNNENFPPRPLEMNPPTPPFEQQKRRMRNNQRPLTPGTGNMGQQSWEPGMVGIGKARAWGGMGGGGRVVSRSGVEVRAGGILPSGGVRAREVSGKVMEEGRGVGNWSVVS